MSGYILGLSGRIASGKSTLAEAAASALKLRRVSFGDEVRMRAKRAGLSATRDNLQALGESLVAADPIAFTKAVLAQANFLPGDSLVVDGIRHLEVLSTLKTLCAPSVVSLVLLELGEVQRQERARARGNIGDLSPVVAEHSTEIQASANLRSAADLVLDGDRPVGDLVKIVCEYVLDRRLHT